MLAECSRLQFLQRQTKFASPREPDWSWVSYLRDLGECDGGPVEGTRYDIFDVAEGDRVLDCTYVAVQGHPIWVDFTT